MILIKYYSYSFHFYCVGRHNVAYNRDTEDVKISKTNFQSNSEAYKRGTANAAMDSSE